MLHVVVVPKPAQELVKMDPSAMRGVQLSKRSSLKVVTPKDVFAHQTNVGKNLTDLAHLKIVAQVWQVEVIKYLYSISRQFHLYHPDSRI